MRDLSSGSILVTGGAGLIGSALVWRLNSLGLSNIFISDRLGRSEKWRNLAPLRFLDYFEADDFERRLAENSALPSGVSTVFHLGACSATTETDAAYLVRNNYEYTKTLAHWSLRAGARFLYASSAATYGSLESDLSESRPLHTLRPLNMYGYSKHRFDCYANAHGLLDRLIGLKYFNVFGPNEHHKGDMRSVVHKSYHSVLSTGAVKLFKSYRPDFPDGGQRRDFLYVKDAVNMTVHLASLDNAAGLYNIGSGHASTWLELAHALFAAMDRPPNIEFVDMPETLRPKYQYFTCADMSRFRSTGYATPLTPLADAVNDYVRSYLIPGRFLGDEPAL